MPTTFDCAQCGCTKTPENTCSIGYGLNSKDEKICYKCIGENDEKEMVNAKVGERFTMYLVKDETAAKGLAASNWPGTLKRPIYYYSTSKTNWRLKRKDVWFKLQGQQFWGYSIGDNTQILHVRKIKP